MKKLLPLALLLGFAAPSNAQLLTNAGMEDWTHYTTSSVPMMKPTGWDSWDAIYMTTLAIKAPGKPFTPMLYKDSVNVHSGTAAAKIITALQGDSVAYSGTLSYGILSYAFDGSTYLGMQAIGGVNVTSRISKASAWLSYHPADISDPGLMQVFAIQTGTGSNGYDSVIGTGYLPIYDDQPYTLASCNIVYKDPTVVPDRILIQFNVSVYSGKAGTEFYIDDVSLGDPTGIETPLFTGQSFKVFPNPAHDVLHIANTAAATEIKIYNMTGCLLRQQAISGDADIDISALPAGNYIYQAAASGTNARSCSGTFTRE